MFASKPVYPTLNHHLPPIRRHVRPPPTPSFNSRTAKAAHIAENVSALKAKYMDYTVWLKNTSRNNREPILKQELLKNSLCRMGIDSDKAEQLVTTCSWYVYQFEKDLQINSQQKIPINSIQMKKSTLFKNKPKKTMLMKDNVEDSTTTVSSLEQDDSFLSISRTNQFVLPPIQVSDSSRPRRVDFDDKKRRKPLQKLKPISSEPAKPLPPPLSLNSSSSSSSRRHGLITGSQTRSILRKQPSISPSSTSTELTRHQKLTPSSITTINDTPLGTRSQRLFGGSECFAQILNELEQHRK